MLLLRRRLASFEMIMDELRRAITDEMLHYFHWPESGWVRKLLDPLLWLPTQKFVRIASRFDDLAARSGFCVAARQILPELIKGCALTGTENIPQTGPLIIAANHPGTFDSLVLAAHLPRADLKTIARGMPFLRILPGARSSLIFSTRDVHVKMTAARAAVQHLRAGGILLLFPSGDLDPDPACLPGAHEALSNWSGSIELLLRKVPETQLQPAILSGLLEPQHLNHPFARWRKDVRQRQIAAEMTQLIEQMVLGGRSEIYPRVTFGKPVRYPIHQRDQNESLKEQIISQAQDLLADHLAAGK